MSPLVVLTKGLYFYEVGAHLFRRNEKKRSRVERLYVVLAHVIEILRQISIHRPIALFDVSFLGDIKTIRP